MKYSKDVNQYKNCKEAGAELERAIPFVARVKLKISEEEARKGLAEMARALFNEGTAMVVSGNKTAKFIAEMMELHQGIYDYSEVDYKDNKTKVKIICREHGPFWQTPNAHKNGRGCPSCARNQNLTTEQVIQQFRDVHGDLYIYTEVDYKGNNVKVKIICQKHGEFLQTPADHKKGSGCPSCGGSKKLTTEQVIQQFREVHGDRYIYTEVVYKGGHVKVKIICWEHGAFWQTPNDHKRGKGCPSCSGTKKLTTEQVIQQFRDVHGDRYIYDEVDYKGSTIKVKIICREHGAFWQTPTDHKRGKGCPECSKATRGRKQKETKAKKRAAKNKNAPVSGAV